MELMIVFMLIINATVAVGLLSELRTNLATLLSRDLGGASALGGVLMSGRGQGGGEGGRELPPGRSG